jgi:flavin-dependent dehydrogenase
MKTWDVIVIGGGLAGSSSAIQLAQAGKQVLLIEKEATAHQKICGEFLSYETQFYLEQFGINLDKLGAETVSSLRIACENTRTRVKLPFLGKSLSRKTLDEEMLNLAEEAGAEIHSGSKVTELKHENNTWNVTLADKETLSARSIFLATGKHDLAGFPRAKGMENDYIALKWLLKLSPYQFEKLSDHIELYLFEGGYAGLENIEDEYSNFSLIIHKKVFAKRHNKKPENLFNHLRDTIPFFSQRLHYEEITGNQPMAMFNIPYGFVYKPSKKDSPNLYRLGDQMGVIPSFAGDGMAIALHTATLAVKHYLNGNAYSYHKQARAALLPQIRRAALLSKLNSFKLIQKLMIHLFELFPRLLVWISNWTRLSDFQNQTKRTNASVSNPSQLQQIE